MIVPWSAITDRVVALDDVDDSGCVFLFQAVEHRVDQAEPCVQGLVGDRDEAREVRCATLVPPAGSQPGVPLKDSKMRLAPLNEALSATSGMPRRFPTIAAHGVLVGGAGEDRRPAAGTRPGKGAGVPGARPRRCGCRSRRCRGRSGAGLGGQPQPGAADRRDQGVGGGPVDDPVPVETAAGVGPVTPKSLVAARTVTWCRRALR